MVIARDIDITSGKLRGATGPWLMLPLQASAEVTAAGSGASAAVGGNPSNPDGSMVAVTMTVPATLGCLTRVRDTVYGSVVGVRFDRGVFATPVPATLIIDGVAYPVKDTRGTRDGIYSGTISDRQALGMVVSGLPDRQHSVEFNIAADATGAASRFLRFFGWIVDNRVGHRQHQRTGLISGATAIGTAFTAITTTTGSGPVRRVWFQNTTAAQRTVTFKNSSSGQTLKTFVLGASGSATDTDFFDFGVSASIPGFGALADVAGVNAFTSQGFSLR